MSNLGFSINTHKHTVSNATLKKFAKLAVANISDVMSRTNGTVDLRPFHKGGRILGRAFTVKTAPGDNLMVHKAIDMAAPGDVIVSGTPGGVGARRQPPLWMKDDDLVEIEVSKIGVLRNRVEKEKK